MPKTKRRSDPMVANDPSGGVSQAAIRRAEQPYAMPAIIRLFPRDEKSLISRETFQGLELLSRGVQPPEGWDATEALLMKYVSREGGKLTLTHLGKQGVEARTAFDAQYKAKPFSNM
jgi:hypothetical protein